MVLDLKAMYKHTGHGADRRSLTELNHSPKRAGGNRLVARLSRLVLRDDSATHSASGAPSAADTFSDDDTSASYSFVRPKNYQPRLPLDSIDSSKADDSSVLPPPDQPPPSSDVAEASAAASSARPKKKKKKKTKEPLGE